MSPAGAFLYDIWVSLFNLKDDLAIYTIEKRRETWIHLDMSGQQEHLLVWTCLHHCMGPRVSSKWKKKNFGSNRNKPKQDLFRVCFGLFRETQKNFFRFVSVFRTYIETTETNRTVSKRTETIRNVLKNLSHIYLGSSVCHIPVIFLSSCHPVIVAVVYFSGFFPKLQFSRGFLYVSIVLQ
jgi:hypothetical protein